MTSFAQRFSGLTKLLVAFVVLALVLAAIVGFGSRDGKRTLTVDFPQTNSVYKGSDVRILGVPVGKIEKLEPKGDVVEVTLSYKGDVKLPQDVKAVVVSPAIVGDRFIQLAPAYSGGPQLADGAHLDVDRTAVPVELDEIYQSIDDLAVALGPEGANKNGALSSLIEDTAAQLDGEGAQLNETIRNFSKLGSTLSNNSDELFGSVREISEFVDLLKRNDATVRAFNASTADVAEVLAGERDDLAGTIKALSTALIDVQSLLKENRSSLKSNVDNLVEVTEVLAKRAPELDEIGVISPTALANVALAYNGKYGTLDNRANLLESILGPLTDPGLLVCALLDESGESEGDLCKTVKDLLDQLGVSDILDTVSGALPRAAAASSVSEPRTVADLLAVDR